MKFGRANVVFLLPIALALLALILFFVVPALNDSDAQGRRLPSRVATRR